MIIDRDQVPSECQDIIDLTDAIFKTVDDFAEGKKLAMGTVLCALFSALISAARSSPGFDPKQFEEDFTASMKVAVSVPMERSLQ